MRTAHRRQEIGSILLTRGEVDYAEVARLFDVSEMTVRRDIEALEREGKARRVRKGAISVISRGYEPSVHEREVTRSTAKASIATVAAGLLSSGDTIYLDAGTTMVAFADVLSRTDMHLFVVTPNLRTVPLLAGNPRIRTVICGGLVRPEEQSVVGSDAEDSLRAFNVDTAFIGTAGVDAERGITDFGIEETRVKQVAMRNAHRVVVLADASKLDHVGLCHVCDISEVDVLVTDTPERHPTIGRLVAGGVRVEHVVGGPEIAAVGQ